MANEPAEKPSDLDGLVERLEYTHEHGVFKAARARKLASHKEAATATRELEARVAELEAENGRLRDERNLLRLIVQNYGDTIRMANCAHPQLQPVIDRAMAHGKALEGTNNGN